MRFPLCLTLLSLAACGNTEPATAEPVEEVPAIDESDPSTEPAGEGAAEAEPTCDDLDRQAGEAIAAVLTQHRDCVFDNECVVASTATRCLSACDGAIHARGLTELRAAIQQQDDGPCAEFTQHDCTMTREECGPSTPRCDGSRCTMDEGDAPLRDVSVPEANRAGQDPPPPRPSPGDIESERGRRLFAAIVADDPALALDFFFPREAFAKVKAIADPDGYWQRLFRRYEQDIHALHEQLGDLSGAEFDRLEIIRRGGWVPRGEEGNALPYWVSRHSQLYYRIGDAERSFEVRVLITWDDRWYVTHLSEFH